jgi:hypothetical protein
MTKVVKIHKNMELPTELLPSPGWSKKQFKKRFVKPSAMILLQYLISQHRLEGFTFLAKNDFGAVHSWLALDFSKCPPPHRNAAL